jgi:CRP-like cAMP-binding protein
MTVPRDASRAGDRSAAGKNLLLRLAGEVALARYATATLLHLRAGDRLGDAGVPNPYIYFPENAVLALVSQLVDGSSLQVASIGREGSTSIITLLGDGASLTNVVVSLSGSVTRYDTSAFGNFTDSSLGFQDIMRLDAISAFNQTQRSAVCAALHDANSRIATWLLTNSERVDHTTMHVSHMTLARLLGVRRATVTVVAHDFRDRGLIEYSRTAVRVINMEGLRGECCCCAAMG